MQKFRKIYNNLPRCCDDRSVTISLWITSDLFTKVYQADFTSCLATTFFKKCHQQKASLVLSRTNSSCNKHSNQTHYIANCVRPSCLQHCKQEGRMIASQQLRSASQHQPAQLLENNRTILTPLVLVFLVFTKNREATALNNVGLQKRER